MSINFQHAAVQNVPYLTTQPHCKIQLRCKNAFVLADGAKFRFKFICRYSANLFMRAVTQISFKILRRRACKHSLAKYIANVPTSCCKNTPAQNTAHQTARRAAHDPSVFGVRHGYSRCKSVAANDCNTPLLAFSARQTFHSCTRAPQAKSAATSPACAVARLFISALRD